jgi:hypothetical protein
LGWPEILQMNELLDMIWIELRKAIRSRMPLWTVLGSLFMPFGIAFLIFVAKNPEISKKLGLVSAKADLVSYAATDWSAYLGFFGMLIAAGGFFFFVLVIRRCPSHAPAFSWQNSSWWQAGLP